MSAVKNLTFFNLHVSFFLFYMQIFLPYAILVTSSTFKFVVIRRYPAYRVASGGDYLKYCSLEVVPLIFCYIIPLNQKMVT